MDTRILALLLLIGVAGSLADLRSPLLRARRNGLQESDRPLVADFAGPSRTKRQTGSASTTKGTTVPTTTPDPTAGPQSTTDKADPTTASSDPDRSTSTVESTTSTAESTTAKMIPTEPATPAPSTPSGLAKPETTKPEVTPSNPTKRDNGVTSSPSTSTTPEPPSASSPSGASSTPVPEDDATTAPTKGTKEPSNSPGKIDPASTTVSPLLGSRINLEDETPGGNGMADPMINMNQGSYAWSPMNPGYPSFPFPPFFVPSFIPNSAYPSNLPGDSAFNVIPGDRNEKPWMGPTNGGGFATSFASASASAATSGNANHNAPPLDNRGGFPGQSSTANAAISAVEPSMVNVNTMNNVPNMVSAGGYGYGGDVPYYDSNAFAFPGYNLETLQRQMEEHFKQLQAQFQRQQQAIFEASNRIGVADGSSPAGGPHTAYSSINLGPGGGYQAGAINPVGPGIASRFGEEIPPPSGNSYGVFSSSSSQTAVGPDGKTVSHKHSTTGVNDNGKITFRTVEE